jgi:hypothetical protein
MPDSTEDRIRRLRRPENAFTDSDVMEEAEQSEAARLGVSVEEYRRGEEVGVWRSGEGGSLRGYTKLPSYTDEQRLRRSVPARGIRKLSDRPGHSNDT